MPKTRYNCPFKYGSKKIKNTGIYYPTLNHVKNFLKKRNYVNPIHAFEKIKILIAANESLSPKLHNVKNIKSKKKFSWS